MKTISIIIPCGGNSSERVRNLDEVLSCLRRQTLLDFELILVEQSINGRYYHDLRECDLYFPIQDPQKRGFNRSWCRNVGAYHASGDLILLMDGDYVFEPTYLEAVTKVQDVFFSGANLFYWSNANLRNQYFQTGNFRIFSKSPLKLRPFIRKVACGGILGFDRHWYYNEFVGFVEDFFGYGFEDTEGAHRILQLLNRKAENISKVSQAVAHLYHKVRDMPEKPNDELYQSMITVPLSEITAKLKTLPLGALDAPNPLNLPKSTQKSGDDHK